MHVVDLSGVKGIVTVIFNGSFDKNMVNGNMEDVFYDVFLY